MTATLLSAVLETKNPTYGVGHAFGLFFVSSVMVAGGLPLLLLVHAVLERTLIYPKWPFVLCTLTYLVLTSARDLATPHLTGRDTVGCSS